MNAQKTCADQPMLKYLNKALSKFNGYFEGRPKGVKRGDETNLVEGRLLQEEQSKENVDGSSTPLKTAIETFKNANAVTVTDLQVCTDYNNQNSCCTVEFEKLVIKKVVRGFYAKSLQRVPKIHKTQRAIYNILNKCSNKQQALQFQGNEELIQINNEFRECHKKGVEAHANLIRGTLCSLCIDPAQIDTYFVQNQEDSKLKINSANFDLYVAAMEESKTCYKSVGDKFKEFIQGYQFPSKCAAKIEKVKEYLKEGKHQLPDQDCKKQAALLEEGCSSQFGDDGKNDSELENVRRILQSSESGYVDDNNGLKAYNVDATQNQELSAELITLDQQDALNEQQYIIQQENEESSGAQIIYMAIGLFAIIFISLI